MTFKQTLQKIESSKVFQQFKEQYPQAELCAGFFILDFLSNDKKKTLDYKINQKIFTFDLKGEDIIMKEDKLIEDSTRPPLEKIEPNTEIELDELRKIAETEASKNNISANLHKIIAVLQKYKHNDEDKQVWNLTCMLENLIVLNILINAQTGEILKFERKSMMDFIKKR